MDLAWAVEVVLGLKKHYLDLWLFACAKDL